jgi:hypothetical protein
VSLRLRRWLVLNTTRNDVELAFFEDNDSVSQMNAQLALEYEEEFIFVGVMVPNELAFDFHELNVLAIELADYARAPDFGELPKFVGEVHLVDLARAHGCRPTAGVQQPAALCHHGWYAIDTCRVPRFK